MEISTLLALPTTSKAFTALRPTARLGGGSGSPPRKVARLHSDSDASASRARPTDVIRGPRRIQLNLDVPQPADAQRTIQLEEVKRHVNSLLTRNHDQDVQLSAVYETVYQACRSIICVLGMGEGLHSNLRIALEKCVDRIVAELGENKSDGVAWLSSFVETCDWFEKHIALLQSLLTYLDRVYLLNEKLPGIRETAYKLFTDRVFDFFPVQVKLRKGIEEWAQWERDNRAEHTARTQIKKLIVHSLTFNRYTSTFERAYLESTRAFYTAESAVLADQLRDRAALFAERCHVRLAEEAARSAAVVPPETWYGVEQATRAAFLNNRLPWLAKDALAQKVEAKDLAGLGALYGMFLHSDGLGALRTAFKDLMQKLVEDIVKDSEHDDEMISNLLDLKSLGDDAVARAFVDSREASSPALSALAARTSLVTDAGPAPAADREFMYALRDAFQVGFKARRVKPAEMIAKYLDRAMRKGQKSASDAEFDSLLDRVLVLYRFTDDKDVFRTFYHRMLAKRLLLARSASDDFEKDVLKKLKEQYDPEFGMGDHMFKDLTLSKDMMGEFHRKHHGNDERQVSVSVLQRSFWPFSARKTDIILPTFMQEQLNKYDIFYKQKHQNRRLEYDHSLGTATLSGQFKPGVKDLAVSLYQAVILLQFNDASELSFTFLKQSIRMEDPELRRTLQSLACGKKKVLKKLPPGKDINDEDVFVFNDAFADPRPRVHINTIQSKETAEETKRTESAIVQERDYTLDAALVRILKARKRVNYETLKAATIDAVKGHFVPEVASIKRRIAALMEQEYMERDPKDQNTYVYIS